MNIKNNRRWFAAGLEVERALGALSDGAFKLYFFLCINAARSTGQITISHQRLSALLKRSRRSIGSKVAELEKKGVCQVNPGLNQSVATMFEICDDYWPYEKEKINSCAATRENEYIHEVKSFLAARACVKGGFTAADQALAGTFQARSISIETLKRAVALGCCRKYVTLLNDLDTTPIYSFHYFRNVIDEILDAQFPVGYWGYIMPELEKLERKYVQKTAHAKFASAPQNLRETR